MHVYYRLHWNLCVKLILQGGGMIYVCAKEIYKHAESLQDCIDVTTNLKLYKLYVYCLIWSKKYSSAAKWL